MDIDVIAMNLRKLEQKVASFSPEALLQKLEVLAPVLQEAENLIERLIKAEQTVQNLLEQLQSVLEGLGHTQERVAKLELQVNSQTAAPAEKPPGGEPADETEGEPVNETEGEQSDETEGEKKPESVDDPAKPAE